MIEKLGSLFDNDNILFDGFHYKLLFHSCGVSNTWYINIGVCFVSTVW